MSLEMIALLASASLVLFMAHVIRVVRQAFLFERQFNLERRFDLLIGLSIGYLVNTFVPFRIGEIVRIFYVTLRTNIRFSLVASTVAVGRISDLAVVAMILPLLSMIEVGHVALPIWYISIFFCAIVAIVVAAAVALHLSKTVRQFVYRCASIFNDRIALELVNLSWLSTQMLLAETLKLKFIVSTILMWILYIASYFLLSLALDRGLFDVVAMLIAAPLEAVSAVDWDTTTHSLLLFTGLPILLVILWGIIREQAHLDQVVYAGVPRLYTPSSNAIFGPFREFDDYSRFLRAHFSSTAPLIADFSMYGLKDAVIQRVLPGGSDALTALVEIEGQFRIRKFAVGSPASKLQVQANWLHEYRQHLPLCDIIAEEEDKESYAFDMPYLPLARDFYEAIHTTSLSESRKILGSVLATVHDFHTSSRQQVGDAGVIDSYLQKKVIDNANVILEFARRRLGDSYSVNGETYSLSEWDVMTDETWLRDQIKFPFVSSIHGDLTIENIIVSPESERGWYIIDPNPDNIFNTELIDWAKVMQSLHLGYEGLNRSGATNALGGDIHVMYSRSDAYANLYADLMDFMKQNLSEEQIREVHFHEIVNYLRLTPYKIRNTPERALTFFASASVLIRNYQQSGHA